MLGREGFWLRIATGEAVEIDEHCRFAASHLEIFGLTPEEVAATGYRGETAGPPRDRMLRLVMSKGWIRMRRHREYVAFQFEQDDLAPALEAIRAFIAGRPKLVWAEDRLEVSNISKGMVFEGKAGEFSAG
jgi:hypothetical protein